MKAIVTSFLMLWQICQAFHPSSMQANRFPTEIRDDTKRPEVESTRRDFSVSIVSSAATLLGINVVTTKGAEASGGATAGGAYLLSAKQRYNTRVSSGVSSFVALKGSLEKGDIDPVRSFFSRDDEGSWKDFSSAGYLLANAFRRNSSAAPDSLPSVQKWKAFAARVEAMTVALKKKDTSNALVVYEAAIVALDDYLEKVELPGAK